VARLRNRKQLITELLNLKGKGCFVKRYSALLGTGSVTVANINVLDIKGLSVIDAE
jgi:hypothetical protein